MLFKPSTLALAATAFSLFGHSLQAPLSARDTANSSPEPKTIYQYPNPTWIENIFARKNGDLLVSFIGKPELHAVHPFTNPPSQSLIHSFTGFTAVFGIAELTTDNFAVIVGNYSLTAGATPGSFSIWTVDLREKTTHVSEVAHVSFGQVLNGLARLNEHAVLAADSHAGTVVKIDTRTKRYEVVIKDKSMAPIPGSALGLGINGLKYSEGYLYYTNSDQKSLMRVAVDCDSGKAIGPFQKVATVPMPDDLAVLDDGTAYVPQASYNVVDRVLPDGTVSVHAGNLNSSVVAGPSGATFGRTWRDRGVVYISTQGGLAGPVNGTFTEGGKIVALGL